jgi:hypothetical protein
MESGGIITAVQQYGFAGFAAVQLVVIVWMIGNLMKAFERNTIAYQRLTSMLQNRPCLKNDRIFSDHEN